MKNVLTNILGITMITLIMPASYAGISASDPTSAFSPVQNPVLEKPQPIWGSVKKPYPTAAWYANIGIRGAEDPNNHQKEEPGLQPLFPTPYTIKSTENGLSFSLPGATTVDTDKYGVFAQIYAFTKQFELASNHPGSKMERRLTDAGELAATLRYEKDSDEYMYAPIVRGAPYITMIYHQLTPVIKANNIQSVNGQAPNPNAPITDKRFQVVSSIPGGSQTWMVYSETPITLYWNNPGTGWELSTNRPFTGWIRAALLDDSSTKVHNDINLLDKYANTVPVDGEVTYQYNDKSATITFKWKTLNGQTPLMMTLPHQRQLLDLKPIDGISMRTNKGEMLGIVANPWVMHEPYPNVTFLELNDPNVLPVVRKQAIIDTLKDEAAEINATLNPDTYGVYTSGKRFARAARLALIADQLGQKDIRDNIVSSIKNNLSVWIQGKNKWKLNYDTTWGGIIPAIDDFGSQYYNDHHFHYGYFIYTMAVLAKLDPTWTNKSVPSTNMTPLEWAKILIRDYANPLRNDRYFPYARHADVFDGHSFASGLPIAFADGRNQESVSEAVNAYYAIALLGKAINDDMLTNWGHLLLAQELRGAHTYWQIPKNSDIYTPAFAKDNKLTAIIFDGKTDRHTFFKCKESDSIALECSYGIEMMPFTAITSQLMAKPWATEFYDDMTSVYNSSLPNNYPWSMILLKGRIMGAPANAFDEIWDAAVKSKIKNDRGDVIYDDGDSKTNTLYVIGAKILSR